jgi:hypothetical protein
MKQLSLLLLFCLLLCACQQEDPQVKPSLVTNEASGVDYFEATLHGTIASLGTEEVSQYGFVGGTTPTAMKSLSAPFQCLGGSWQESPVAPGTFPLPL